MFNPAQHVVVLWGLDFEALAATIFITEFRQAGSRASLVGLAKRPSKGVHGLSLVPDTTLDQINGLAAEIAYIIIPCTSPGGELLRTDPRWPEFFGQFQTGDTVFVIGRLAESVMTASGLADIAPGKVMVYPARHAQLVEFAQDLAALLLG